MRHLFFALAFVAAPAAAQDAPETGAPPSMIEQGLRMFMEGLMEEMAPTVDDMEETMRNAAPLLEGLKGDLARALESVEDSLGAYSPPEMLPNGDIIIRRKHPEEPLPDGVEPNTDGSIDL